MGPHRRIGVPLHQGIVLSLHKACTSKWVTSLRHFRVNAQVASINSNVPKQTDNLPKSQELLTIADIPGPSGRYALPYIGSAFLFHPFTPYKLENSNRVFSELHRKYGPIVKFRSGAKWNIALFHPDLFQQAIASEGSCPVRPSPPLQDAYTKRHGGVKSISQVQGEEWQAMRRPVQEFILQPVNIQQYIPALNQVANEFIGTIQQSGNRIQVKELMLRYAIESSAVYCINSRLGFLQESPQEQSTTESLKTTTPEHNTTTAATTETSETEKPELKKNHPHTCPYHDATKNVSKHSKTTSERESQVSNTGKHTNRDRTETTSANSQDEEDKNQADTDLVGNLNNMAMTLKERSELMEMIQVYMAAIGEGYYKFPLYKLWRTKLYRDFEKATLVITSLCGKRVHDVLSQLQQTDNQPTSRPNLLQFLVSDGRLDLRTCVVILGSFFSTATDNVSNSLTILLWQLAKHPDVQERLRQEILECVTSQSHVTSEVLGHMPYLKACLKESHRLVFPSPMGSLRIMPQDTVIGRYKVPKGTSVYSGHNSLCTSDQFFEKPLEYLPERWLRRDGQDAVLQRQQAFIALPFGHGKRNCLGRRLAENQIYLAVIKILQHYRLQLADPEEELKVVYKITAMSDKPLNIRFEPLHPRSTSNFCVGA